MKKLEKTKKYFLKPINFLRAGLRVRKKMSMENNEDISICERLLFKTMPNVILSIK